MLRLSRAEELDTVNKFAVVGHFVDLFAGCKFPHDYLGVLSRTGYELVALADVDL